MTDRCPIHNKPLVRTHGGSLVCIPCRTPERKARYTIAWTDKPKATLSKQAEYHREYYRKHRGPKKMAERAARNPGKPAGAGQEAKG